MTSDRTIDFRYAPPLRWTAICRPDDAYKTLVREDGALLYGYRLRGLNASHFSRVVEFGILADHEPLEVAQRTEDAACPIVTTTLRYRHAALELTVFAHQHDDGRRSDVVLWTIRASATKDEILTGLRVEVSDAELTFSLPSAAPGATIFAVPREDVAPVDMHTMLDGELQPLRRSDRLTPAFVSTPHALEDYYPSGFRPNAAFATAPHILCAGEELSGAIVLPQGHAALDGLDLAWALAARDEERRFWRGFREGLTPIDVPDSAVNDMIVACARNIMQAREVHDGLPVFQVGATIYRRLFVVDGHFMLECAHYLGYRDEVTGALDRLLKGARPDGSIAEMPFHTKETAIALATVVRQCELLGDDERLRGYWPAIRTGVAYIERLRAEAAALPPDAPNYRLMPAAFADGGSGGRRPEYSTTLWTLAGLKAVAEAAGRLGYREDAARFGAAYDALLADLRRCAARDMRALPDGTPYLPMVLPGSGEHHNIPNFAGAVPRINQLQPATATWALCQAIWPGEILAPDDPLVQNLLRLLDTIDDEEGIPAETGWYPYRSLWSYYASFAAHVWLYAGVPEKAIDYLYAFANHATPTRVWREEQSWRSTYNGQFCGDMPHNWASAEFIRLVRHLLVFERGEALELLPGLPAEWRVPGKHVRLERTPTRFGPLSLHVRFDENGARVELALASHGARRPAHIRLHAARLGSGQLRVNGEPAERDADGTIELPSSGAATVEVRA